MMWALLASAAYPCSSTAEYTWAPPSEALVWPRPDVVAPSDTYLVVWRFHEGPLDAQLLDPAGTPVPLTAYDLSETLTVLVPVAPLVPGAGYRFVPTPGISGEVSDLVIDDLPLEPLGATPGAVRREVVSDVVLVDERCPDEAPPPSSVAYELCESFLLGVALLGGDTAPPEPTSLVDLDPRATVATGRNLALSDGLSSAWSGTVWLGTFDAHGRFRGWIPDPLEMPAAGTTRYEASEPDPIWSTTPTPPIVLACPTPPTTWFLVREVTLDGPSRGCESSPSPRWWLLLAPALLRRRRRLAAP